MKNLTERQRLRIAKAIYHALYPKEFSDWPQILNCWRLNVWMGAADIAIRAHKRELTRGYKRHGRRKASSKRSQSISSKKRGRQRRKPR